jgi:hypothetical protein
MLHKVIVLYLLYGFVIPRTNLWTSRDSCLYGQLGTVGSAGNIISPRGVSANELPAFSSSLRVKARYYRSFNPPQILTEEREFVDSQPISNRVSYLSDVFFSKTHILQYKDWLIVQWGFFKPASGGLGKFSHLMGLPFSGGTKGKNLRQRQLRPLAWKFWQNMCLSYRDQLYRSTNSRATPSATTAVITEKGAEVIRKPNYAALLRQRSGQLGGGGSSGSMCAQKVQENRLRGVKRYIFRRVISGVLQKKLQTPVSFF